MTTDRRANGATVRAFRKARGLLLQDLADRVGTVSRGHLSHIENGRYRPTEPLTAALAQALDVPTEALTGQIPPIQQLRTILGVDPGDLASAAGITPERFARIERGTERLLPEELGWLAGRLGVDPAALSSAADRAAVA